MEILVFIIIMILVGLLLITIPTRKGKNMSWMSGVSSHRGWFLKDQSIAENSMSAFKLSLEKNLDIELDVRMTKDHQIIAFHDSNLERMCQSNILVEEATYYELLQFKLGNSNEGIPLLSEVLNEVGGKVNLFVEIKPTENIEFICELVTEQLDQYNGNFTVCSFQPLVLMWFRKNRPGYIRGQNIQLFLFDKRLSIINRVLLTINGYNLFTRADYISVHFKLAHWFSWMRFFKGFISSWAISSDTDYLKLKKKVDHLIIEFLDYD